jgi:hypothetical protein
MPRSKERRMERHLRKEQPDKHFGLDYRKVQCLADKLVAGAKKKPLYFEYELYDSLSTSEFRTLKYKLRKDYNMNIEDAYSRWRFYCVID